MKKIALISTAAILGLGGYFHYHKWESHTHKIKEHIERFAEGKSDRFLITYDKIEQSGYPFRQEVTLTNPCLSFLSSEEAALDKMCLQGILMLSYNPYAAEESIYIDSDGVLEAHQKDQAGVFVLNGKLKQEYHLNENIDFSQALQAAYLMENIGKASVTAKNLSFSKVGDKPQEMFKDLNGSLAYSKQPYDDQSQKITLWLDYSAYLGSYRASHETPLPYLKEITEQLEEELAAFNKKSGLNQGRLDCTFVVPNWSLVLQLVDKVQRLDFALDEVPNFSIAANQVSKNDFMSGKSTTDFKWQKEGNQLFELVLNNHSTQEITKEGETEISNLLRLMTKEFVALLKREKKQADGTPAAIQPIANTPFDGFPTSLSFDVDLKIKKTKDAEGRDQLDVAIKPLSLITNKGSFEFTADYPSDGLFEGELSMDSFVRVVDGILTRYNWAVPLLRDYHKLPLISEQERDQLLAILQKYSNTPKSLGRKVSFTVKEGEDGSIYIGEKQPILGLVGELAFFLQHLQQKVE